jgi:hypothetical protein
MAIVEKGQGVNVGATEIPDNDSESIKISATDAKDYIIANTSDGSESVTLAQHTMVAGATPIVAPQAPLHVVGIGGSTGADVSSISPGAATPILYLDAGNAASANNRCTLMMNADGGSGCQVDMYVGDDRKLNMSATASQQTITAEDSLVVTSESGGATRIAISASNFNVQDLATIHAKNSADNLGASYEFRKSRHAGDGAHTVLQDNDVIGEIKFSGSDGDSYATGAQIFARVRGTPGDGDMPCELVFAMSKDDSETPVETLRIMPTATANKAQVTIGTDSYASAYTYSPLAVDAETQNGPVFERSGAGNIMLFQFNTKNCITGSSHPISLMPGGTERLEIGTNGVCKLAASSAIQYNSGVGTDTATTEPVYLADTNGTMIIDFNKGNFGDVTLAANVTAVKFFNAPADGTTATITAKITQDSSNRTFDYGDSAVTVYSDGGSTAVTGEIKFAGGTHHVQSTGSADVDLVSFTCIPSGSTFNIYAKVIGQAFA